MNFADDHASIQPVAVGGAFFDMALDQMPIEWRAWIRENTERECSPGAILSGLVGGGFAHELSTRAVVEAIDERRHRRGLTTDRAASCPEPRVTNNFVDLPERRIRVLASLERPRVHLFADVLSNDECDALAVLGQSQLALSTVVDDEAGSPQTHPHRTSAGAFFHRAATPLIASIEERIAQLVRWPVDHGEGLQVTRYDHGGEYRAHFDYFDPAKPGSAQHLVHGGQRVATVILYLTDVDTGGATRFPSAGFEVRPQKGSALYFDNLDEQGAVDGASLHAGMPVIAGVKLIATKWLRQQAYRR